MTREPMRFQVQIGNKIVDGVMKWPYGIALGQVSKTKDQCKERKIKTTHLPHWIHHKLLPQNLTTRKKSNEKLHNSLE